MGIYMAKRERERVHNKETQIRSRFDLFVSIYFNFRCSIFIFIFFSRSHCNNYQTKNTHTKNNQKKCQKGNGNCVLFLLGGNGSCYCSSRWHRCFMDIVQTRYEDIFHDECYWNTIAFEFGGVFFLSFMLGSVVHFQFEYWCGKIRTFGVFIWKNRVFLRGGGRKKHLQHPQRPNQYN